MPTWFKGALPNRSAVAGKFELGNPLWHHLSGFFKRHRPTLISILHAAVDGRKFLGVHLDRIRHRQLELQIGHILTLTETERIGNLQKHTSKTGHPTQFDTSAFFALWRLGEISRSLVNPVHAPTIISWPFIPQDFRPIPAPNAWVRLLV